MENGMKRKRRTHKEVVALYDQCIAEGAKLYDFSKAHDISFGALYLEKRRRAGKNNGSDHNGSATVSDLAQAIAILRKHGIKLPRKYTQSHEYPKLKRHDLKTMKKWLKESWDTNERIVVGWKKARVPYLIFHSLSGLQGRQKHVESIREKVNG